MKCFDVFTLFFRMNCITNSVLYQNSQHNNFSGKISPNYFNYSQSVATKDVNKSKQTNFDDSRQFSGDKLENSCTFSDDSDIC